MYKNHPCKPELSILQVWFQDSALAQQTNFLQGVINSALEGVYAGFDAPVADVAGTFLSGDLVTDNNGNSVPDSIDLL